MEHLSARRSGTRFLVATILESTEKLQEREAFLPKEQQSAAPEGSPDLLEPMLAPVHSLQEVVVSQRSLARLAIAVVRRWLEVLHSEPPAQCSSEHR
jgi:hypothetical protein